MFYIACVGNALAFPTLLPHSLSCPYYDAGLVARGLLHVSILTFTSIFILHVSLHIHIIYLIFYLYVVYRIPYMAYIIKGVFLSPHFITCSFPCSSFICPWGFTLHDAALPVLKPCLSDTGSRV